MSTLIIYDNNGTIFSQITGSYAVPSGGIQFLEVEIPEGKQLMGVDVSVTPHQPILEEIPKTETELLKDQIKAQEEAILELAEIVAGGV